MRSVLFVTTLAFACGGEQSKSPEPTPPSAEATPTSIESAAHATPATKGSDAGAAREPSTNGSDNCVKDCVASRQMQATSIEHIEQDCQAQCSGNDASGLNGK